MIKYLAKIFSKSIGRGLFGREKRRFRRFNMNKKDIDPEIKHILDNNFWDLI